MSLHPTKTRLALLADVDAGRVFRDRIGDSYINGSRKVTVAIAELRAAGWVWLPAGDLPRWQLTDPGRALLRREALGIPNHGPTEHTFVDGYCTCGEHDDTVTARRGSLADRSTVKRSNLDVIEDNYQWGWL